MTVPADKPVKVQCVTHNVALGSTHAVTRDKEVVNDDELNKGDTVEMDADLAKFLIDREQVKRV